MIYNIKPKAISILGSHRSIGYDLQNALAGIIYIHSVCFIYLPNL
jgi:hypothetical protein